MFDRYRPKHKAKFIAYNFLKDKIFYDDKVEIYEAIINSENYQAICDAIFIPINTEIVRLVVESSDDSFHDLSKLDVKSLNMAKRKASVLHKTLRAELQALIVSTILAGICDNKTENDILQHVCVKTSQKIEAFLNQYASARTLRSERYTVGKVLRGINEFLNKFISLLSGRGFQLSKNEKDLFFKPAKTTVEKNLAVIPSEVRSLKPQQSGTSL
ncbi:MAG: hypothetical protein ACE365_02505 [Gammaproteobacteria bacterium]